MTDTSSGGTIDMKSWKEDNYLNRLNESNEGMFEDLVKLANGEVAAATQYMIAYNNIVQEGKESEYLRGHFKEHSRDEWKHNGWLTSYLWRNRKNSSLEIQSSVSESLPPTEELEGADKGYLREFFYKAEDDAVKAYSQFLKTYGSEADDTLKKIIKDIIEDEIDHRGDFEEEK